MPTREQVLALLREAYPYLAAEDGIKKVGIFGSYAKGVPDEASDVVTQSGLYSQKSKVVTTGYVLFWVGFGKVDYKNMERIVK